MSKDTIMQKAEEKRQRMAEEANLALQLDMKEDMRKARAQRDALFEKAMSEEIAKVMQAANVSDGNGRTITLWQKAMDSADRAINSGQTTYHDLRSALMDMVLDSTHFAEAINQSAKELIYPYVGQMKLLLKVKLYQVKDTLVDKCSKEPKVEIPTFLHNVSMGADHKIIRSIKSNYDFNEKTFMDAGLESLTDLWLLDNGYKPEFSAPASKADKPTATGRYVRVDNGKVLTDDDFNELKKSKEHGLDKFLNTGAKTVLNFKEDHKLSPTTEDHEPPRTGPSM